MDRKPVAKYYIKNYRVNIEEDYEMYRISALALDAANPYKLKQAVLSLGRYEIWSKLKTIDVPTLIVGTSKDLFNNHQEMLWIADELRDCAFFNLETHQRTHSREIADVVT